MKHDYFNNARAFVQTYLKSYSNRDLQIIDYFDDDFMGLDGITTKVYDKSNWIKALKHDYKEIEKPFEIKITHIDMRLLDNGFVTVAVISLWCIPIFENTPEFDKMRTVFILRPTDNSFNITHISNSLSLLPLNPDDVYPTDLIDFLKHYKEATLGRIKNDDKNS